MKRVRKSRSRSTPYNFRLALLLAVFVTACGGGGGSNNTPGEPPWGTASFVGLSSSEKTYAHQIGVDPNGNAIAIWLQSDVSSYNVTTNRYTPGAGWGSTVTYIGAGARIWASPQIAINSKGDAVSVWSEFDGLHDSIRASVYSTVSGWGTATLIETDNSGEAVFPQVAIDPDGNAIAVWRRSAYPAPDSIWANRYTAGTGWGTAQLIETDESGHADHPQITMDANGNAIAVWHQFDGSHTSIWANRYTIGSGWGTAEIIENNNTGNADSPQIAMDPKGNAIAVWPLLEATRTDIWANRYVPGTGWGAAELIETDNTDSASTAHVDIAMDQDGDAIAVWELYDGTKLNIWTNRYTPGPGWGSATPIMAGAHPQIGVDSNGNAIAVWRSSGIWAARYGIASGWGTPRLIESALDADRPRIAANSKGDAFALWSRSALGRDELWAYRFK